MASYADEEVGLRLGLRPEHIGFPGVLVNMKHRGVEYSVVQGSPPNIWRWSVMVGQPAMLRVGVAQTEQQAEMEVWRVIDRALDVVEAVRFSKAKRSD